MSKSSIDTGAFINIGKRKKQEDSYLVSQSSDFNIGDKEKFIGVVTDGMGGLKYGYEAGERAVQRLRDDFEEIKDQPEIDFSKFLLEEVHEINHMIYTMARHEDIGTTMSAVILEDNVMHMVSVGDSRVYILRDGKLYLLTREHNFRMILQKALVNGRITRQVYNDTQAKSALVSYLGTKELKYVDITEEGYQLMNGDVILLCTDGLTKTVKDHEIENILNAEKDNIPKAAEVLGLFTLSKEKKKQDNVAIVLLKYVE